MRLLFRESFAKDLKAIRDKELLARIKQTIESAASAPNLQAIPQIRKLRESGNYYRIRVGPYRLGLLADKDEVIFVRCLHRREVYRYFP